MARRRGITTTQRRRFATEEKEETIMTENVQLILIANIFRIMRLLVGFGFGYLGYGLYVKGVFDKTEDINASFGSAKIALRNVAPGVVFGIAGIVVAILSVVRPIKVDQTVSISGNIVSSQPATQHGSIPRLLEHKEIAFEDKLGSLLRTCQTYTELLKTCEDELTREHDQERQERSTSR
jgi:inner membrane protein involved in colicin E2 resistance